jgi:hypothetical protein
VFLDQDQESLPEPFREKYMRSLEDRVETLEDEVYRQQAIILSMSQSLQALTGGSESPETASEEAERVRVPQEPQEGVRRPWWRRVLGG